MVQNTLQWYNYKSWNETCKILTKKEKNKKQNKTKQTNKNQSESTGIYKVFQNGVQYCCVTIAMSYDELIDQTGQE